MVNPAMHGAVRRAEHDLIREALERAVDRHSPREGSRQVWMAPSGPQGLIDGAGPAGPDLIRDALERAVDRTSLREVSRQVSMSPSGLQGLIDGAQPYGKTAEKLRRWYALHADDSEPALAPETAIGL